MIGVFGFKIGEWRFLNVEYRTSLPAGRQGILNFEVP
jgi:hypothetical protein